MTCCRDLLAPYCGKLDYFTMATIGASEAKVHLSRLLEQVTAGEQFVITRYGKPVAQLIPIDSEDESGRSRREAAVLRLKTVGDGNRLERLTIRKLITVGRRF